MIKTYFTSFYRSIFSPDLYADVIHRWKGTGVLYLLFLSFFIAVILALRLSITLMSVPDQEIDYFLKQIPVIEITSGEMTTDVDLPYDIKLKDESVLVRFLETADLDTVQAENENVPVMVTSTQLLIAKDQSGRRSQLRVQSLDDIEDMVIDRSVVKKLWDTGKVFFPFVVIPFVALGSFVGYLLQSLAIALISYVVTAFMKEEYDFATRLRMSVVAFTPVLLVNQLSELILHHKMNFAMMAAMATLYIFVMIKTSRSIEA